VRWTTKGRGNEGLTQLTMGAKKKEYMMKKMMMVMRG